MKKFLLGLVFFFVFACLFFVIFTVNKLPGKNEIKSLIDKNNKSKSLVESSVKGSEKLARLNSDLKNEDGKQKNDLVPGNEKIKEATGEEFVIDLLNEDIQDIRVCENLGKSALLEKHKGVDVPLEDILEEKTREDAYTEALRIPLKAIFQDSKLSSFLHEILDIKRSNLDQEEKDSFLEKMGFYSRATVLSAHLYSKKNEFENLGDHAIHLSVLATLAHLKPDLAQNDEVRSLCDDIEKSIKNKKLFDIKKERGSILSLIKKAGLKASDVNFDPNQFIKFKMQINKKGLTFNLSTKEDGSR